MSERRAAKPATVKVGNIKVTIYQRERDTATGKRIVYEVADYSSGERRMRGFSDAQEARLEAERIARQMSAGDSMAAQLTNADAVSYCRAVEFLRPTGIPLESAAQTFADCLKVLGENRLLEASRFFVERSRAIKAPKAVADVVSELIAVKVSDGASDRYVQDLRSRLSRFAESFKTEIGKVTKEQIQAWFDGLGLGPQSHGNFRRVVGLLFKFAVARGYATSNLVDGIDKKKVRGGDVEIFATEEIQKMLAAADPEFLPVLAIGAFAGLRTAEIERLSWEEIDLVGGYIEMKATKAKTGSRRVVPIQGNLAAWLAPYAGRVGNVWQGDSATLLNRQRQTAKACGMAWKHNALRHSYASYRLAETGDATRIAFELGNSPAIVHRHYKQLVRPEAAKSWFSIKPAVESENIIRMAAV
ncbi:MAG TPA: hypothetical protein VGO67_16425 [Verrucomicrobiae bacterium]